MEAQYSGTSDAPVRVVARFGRKPNARWLGDAIGVFSAMANRRTWSARSGIAYALACCLALQALIAGLHAAHAPYAPGGRTRLGVDQQLIAGDPSICHGGNSTPAEPRPDRADICCLLACSISTQSATLAELVNVPRQQIVATIQLPLHFRLWLRSHLLDRAPSRPRSPPSA